MMKTNNLDILGGLFTGGEVIVPLPKDARHNSRSNARAEEAHNEELETL